LKFRQQTICEIVNFAIQFVTTKAHNASFSRGQRFISNSQQCKKILFTLPYCTLKQHKHY